ncbi:YybS family protein [Sporosarcina sp. YIM B06819]|uniref:YybS family protein n=1 Tax=Sporosarcina sp. YIM B06819 TaxID=3081769 RepID=UPI00298C3705|nr:YybS family protein [Sporosarcina sp. YIM B06819]
MQDNARKITYGAMMIALFAILLAVSLYAPLLGNVTMFFIPLPIILYRLRYDRTSSLLVTATGVMLSLLIGGILLVPFALIHGLLGFVVGETVKTGKTKLYSLMATGLTLLITGMMMYVAAVFAFNFNAIDELFKVIDEVRVQMSSFMGKVGGLPDNYNEMMDSQIEFYQTAIPSMFIISVFVLAFIYITLNLEVASRLGNAVPKFPPFREMKLPVMTVILYGVVLLLSLFVATEPGTNFYLISINATMILRFLFLLQGISLIHHYMHEMKLPKVVTVVATGFALLLSPITTMLGILDAGMNIRAWIRKDKVK